MKSSDSTSHLKIKCEYTDLISVNKLKEHPKNRNSHSKEQIDRLVKLIEFQGFRCPIIISNLSGYIVAGHGRLYAAKSMGLDKVPVDYQDFQSEEAEYAFLVSDNAIASWSELDFSGINTDIGDLGPFDIDLLGIKNFDVEIPFNEPKEKNDPTLKKTELNKCPNCGVLIERG